MAVRYDIIMTYPPRGPLQQYRLATTSSFTCFRCRSDKTSKLVTVADGSWSRLLCNGCYGRLVALYDIRAGADSPEVKADRLAGHLASMIAEDELCAREALLRVRRDVAKLLDPASLRFLATADCVAEGLQGHTDLDWSAAIIGLCKALEVELVRRVAMPLRQACVGVELSHDIEDRDLGRLARYCAASTDKPPEMGVLRHALVTAESSTSRSASSPLLGRMRGLGKSWPRGDWVFNRDGLVAAVEKVTTKYRNPAAHTDTLRREDYSACRELVAGNAGALWLLVQATTSRR